MFGALRSAATLSVLAVLALAIATPADARRIDEAEAKAAAVIQELGIPQSRIESIYLAPRLTGGRDSNPQGYNAWIKLNDCTGNLVIAMTSTAHVSTMYTTGDCSVPGVD